VWYALTDEHPKEPMVVHAALTRKDVFSEPMDDRAKEILRTIDEYERELRIYRAGR
jgi:hypothetical protein